MRKTHDFGSSRAISGSNFAIRDISSPVIAMTLSFAFTKASLLALNQSRSLFFASFLRKSSVSLASIIVRLPAVRGLGSLVQFFGRELLDVCREPPQVSERVLETTRT